MEKIKEGNALQALVILLIWTMLAMMVYLAHEDSMIRTIEDNLMDIDQRLTTLEQSQCIADSALVDALQKVNECMYYLNNK